MLWWFWMDQQQISETFMVWLQDIKYRRRVRKAYLSWEFYLNHGIIWLGVTTRATNLNFLSRITWFLFRLNTVSWFVALWGCNSICRVLHFSWNRKQKAIVCQGFIRANQVIYSCTDKSMWKKEIWTHLKVSSTIFTTIFAFGKPFVSEATRIKINYFSCLKNSNAKQ